MPLLKTKHQPYFPDPDSPANYQCGTEQYCHPLTPDDTIRTQFYQTPCAGNQVTDPNFEAVTMGAELITNGTFAANANGWESAGNPLPTGEWAWDASQRVKKSSGVSTDSLYQDLTGLLSLNENYKISFDLDMNIRYIQVVFDGVTYGGPYEYMNTQSIEIGHMFTGALEQIEFLPSYALSTIYLDNISVRQVTFDYWTHNGSWMISNGAACHIGGTTGLLIQNVADYILAGEYWTVTITVTGWTTGTCDVYLATDLCGTIAGNGTFTYYAGVAADGVLSFDPSSDFDGCLSAPATYKLRSDFLFSLVTADGSTSYNISSHADYYHEYITLNYPMSSEDRDYGCYYLESIDSCLTSGDVIMEHGRFSGGGEGWSVWANPQEVDFSADEATFIHDPLTALTNQLTNEDFATGDFTGWTAGANWAVVGNAAVHTPGSTATLKQSVTIAPYTLPAQYWYRVVIAGRTAGSVTISFGNFTSQAYDFNGTITYLSNGTPAGATDFTITPSSDFDGSVDDLFFDGSATNNWSGSPQIVDDANTLITEANYELSFDIISNTDDTQIFIAGSIQGATQNLDWKSTVGTHTIALPNYTPGAQRVYFKVVYKDPSGPLGLQNTYPGAIIIDNVELRAVEPFEATYISECLNYQATHHNTKLLTAYCDQNAFGMEFENTGYKLTQRAVVRSYAPSHNKEKQVAKYGTGNAAVVYAGDEKYWQLHTAFASETFHDALSVMIDCDHFHVGDNEEAKEYIAEVDDYNPQWIATGQYSLAPAVINIRVKEEGQTFNRHT